MRKQNTLRGTVGRLLLCDQPRYLPQSNGPQIDGNFLAPFAYEMTVPDPTINSFTLRYECVAFREGHGELVLPYRLLFNARMQTIAQREVFRRACRMCHGYVTLCSATAVLDFYQRLGKCCGNALTTATCILTPASSIIRVL